MTGLDRLGINRIIVVFNFYEVFDTMKKNIIKNLIWTVSFLVLSVTMLVSVPNEAKAEKLDCPPHCKCTKRFGTPYGIFGCWGSGDCEIETDCQ